MDSSSISINYVYATLVTAIFIPIITNFSDQIRKFISESYEQLFGSLGYKYVSINCYNSKKKDGSIIFFPSIEYKVIIESIINYIQNQNIVSNSNYIIFDNKELSGINNIDKYTDTNYDDNFKIVPTNYIMITLDNKEVVYVKYNKQSDTELGFTEVITLKAYNIDTIKDFINLCKSKYDFKKCNSSVLDQHLYIHDAEERYYMRYKFITNKSFDTLFYHDKDKILSVIEKFNRKNLPKLSILLHGISGSGKTSCIKSIAKLTKRDIFYIKISSIASFNDFINMMFSDHIRYLNPGYDHWDVVFKSVPPSKRIYIFEDVDCESSLLNKRIVDPINDDHSDIGSDSDFNDKSKQKKKNLNLSDILNTLDGILELKDVIMIFTTNHINNIDPAMFRYGRINAKFEFTTMRANIINEMVISLIGYHLDDKYLKDNYITPAHLEMLINTTNSQMELCDELDKLL